MDDPDVEAILASIRAERADHLARFRGREALVEQVLAELRSEPAGYVVLVGPESHGKSALLAEVTRRWSDEQGPAWAPWLPHCLLGVGRQLHSAGEVWTALSAQLAGLGVEVQTGDPSGLLGAATVRRRLRLGLEELGGETDARILLAFDDLERASPDPGGPTFLPRLPDGVSGLITSRGGAAVNALRVEYPTVVLPIERVDRHEIPAILGVPDRTAEGRAFNDAAYESSDGWMLPLVEVARRIARAEGDWGSADPVARRDDVLAIQARRWGLVEDPLMADVLALLSVTEPIGPVLVDSVVGFLGGLGRSITQPALLARLQDRVHDQVDFSANGRIGLSLSLFAEHAREAVLGPRLTGARLLAWVRWSCADPDVPPVDAMNSAMRWWDDHRFGPGVRAAWGEAVGSVAPARLDDLAAAQYIDASPFAPLRDYAGPAVVALQAGADQGDPTCRARIAAALLHGDGVEPDEETAVAVLAELVEDGLPLAMFFLSMWGLVEEPADWPLEESAEDLFDRSIAEGDPDAATVAIYLVVWNAVYDPEVETELSDGLELLDRLSWDEWGNRRSLEGLFRLQGSVAEDPAEGLAMLEAGARAEEPTALLTLLQLGFWAGSNQFGSEAGRQLFDAEMAHVARPFLEGAITLLLDTAPPDLVTREGALQYGRRAVELGHQEAEFALGLALAIDVRATDEERTEGLELLRRVGDRGAVVAAFLVAGAILNGDLEERYEGEALARLEAATDAGHQQARSMLARLLMEADEPRPDEAAALLREGVADGHPWAAYTLAEYLLDGDLEPEEDEEGGGEALHRRMIDMGFSPSFEALGGRLMRADGVVEDRTEGAALLFEALRLGDPDAADVLRKELPERDADIAAAEAVGAMARRRQS